MPTSWSADLTSVQRVVIFQYLIEGLWGSRHHHPLPPNPWRALQGCSLLLHLPLAFLSIVICSISFSASFKTRILDSYVFFPLYSSRKYYWGRRAGEPLITNYFSYSGLGAPRMSVQYLLSPAFWWTTVTGCLGSARVL